MLTFLELLLAHAQDAPAKTAYRFFQGTERAPETLTFHQLWTETAALAARLQARGLARQRVLIVCKSQRHFVPAFYACLLAGATAVPTAVPRRQNLLGRLQLLASDAQASAIMADSDEVRSADLGGADIAWFDLREPAGAHGEADAWRMPALRHADLAFLQYTSGSTGEPKGVMVTHGNLIHNSEAIRRGMELGRHSVVLTALPLFHDMGLVGGMLQPMYCGCEANVLSPAEFVQFPERWLRYISDYRVTASGGPNFMFQLAASSIKDSELDGVDLSSWRVAFCGAEPVRASTIEQFTRRFAPSGFRPESFFPCYGMAEATLYITGKPPAAPPAIDAGAGEQAPVVGCGVARHGMDVRIVDPDTGTEVPARAQGEIWVSGDSVAAGYWNKPALSERTFQARLPGSGQAFLRTGDLGYLHDGQLYVTGRLKDLIILYGRNYAPHDIEDAAERSHPALRQAGCAAFSIPGAAHERVVLVAELTREFLRRPEDWDAAAAAVRTRVRATLELPLEDVVFIQPGTLPRTSSGKVRRSATKAHYLSGELALAAARAAVPASASN